MKLEIQDIVISEEKRTELNKILQDSKYSHHMKVKAIKDTLGGPCSIDGALPTKIITYKIEGASVVQRYCTRCFERIQKEAE